jgi:hypothetical protein
MTTSSLLAGWLLLSLLCILGGSILSRRRNQNHSLFFAPHPDVRTRLRRLRSQPLARRPPGNACQYCGKQASDSGASFCWFCGQALPSALVSMTEHASPTTETQLISEPRRQKTTTV